MTFGPKTKQQSKQTINKTQNYENQDQHQSGRQRQAQPQPDAGRGFKSANQCAGGPPGLEPQPDRRKRTEGANQRAGRPPGLEPQPSPYSGLGTGEGLFGLVESQH